MKHKKLILLFFLFIATIAMGIGYATINGTLLVVNGIASVIKVEPIRITNVSYLSNNGANLTDSSINDYYGTVLNSTITLGNSSTSTITYSVTIINESSDTIIFSGTSYSAPLFYDNSNIAFDLSNISPGDTIAANATKTFSITFKYAGNDTSMPTLNSYISFDFNTGSYQVGDQVVINLQSKNSSSSWMTNTNGYNATTGNYNITDTSDTYVIHSGTFTKENLDWYVWKIDANKMVLISGRPTTMTLNLNYVKSYNNALFFMNDIANELYGCNINGVTARSINMVDILEKVFEHEETVTYNGNTINLVDGDGKALTSIITTNTTDMQNVIKGLFNTNYGNGFTAASVQKYIPQTLYDLLGLTGTPQINFSTASNVIRDFENSIITAPVTTGNHATGNFKPVNWTYSITNPSSVLDSTSLSMLSSNDSFWIASRDYSFTTNSNKANYYFNVKQWNNNQIVPVTIYKSNITTGQTVLSAKIRPMIELDLTKVTLNSDGSITSKS